MASRQFINADYEATLDVQVRLGDVLPADHPARFLVDLLHLVDFGAFRAHFGVKGGRPYDPLVLCGLLIHGYIHGLFSSRRIERATYEDLGYRYVAGNLHPDHDTLAHFRKTFLPEIAEVFVQVLLMAKLSGVLLLEAVSNDGTKIHANASKSAAVSYGRLLALEQELRAEVEALLAQAAQADGSEEATRLQEESSRREERLAQLALARRVLEERAAARDAEEQAAYEAKRAERAAKQAATGKVPRGKEPQPPTLGPQAKDQYNFTDPASRIMKESKSGGFEQSYNAQVATDQGSMLITGAQVADQPNDVQQLLPTLDAIPPAVGKPAAATADAGFFSEPNIQGCAAREIDPFIATGREPHRWPLDEVLTPPTAAGPEAPSPAGTVAVPATPRAAMAAKLRQPAGRAIYRLRKCTVEPAIGIIKEAMGFRQFSLRGLDAVNGEWLLVCLAYNIKRLRTLWGGVVPAAAQTTDAARQAAALVVVLLTALASLLGHLFQHDTRAAGKPSPNATHTVLCRRGVGFSPTSC